MRLSALVLVMCSALPATADDYLIVFGADGIPYRPTKAHTFAAVVRVEAGPGGAPQVADLKSLSWLPASGTVRALAFRPEVGRNVPLDETLRTYAATGSRICIWGPYAIRPDAAQKFRDRVATVESSFKYKAASYLSPLSACDCARSVEESVGPRRFIGAFGYGAAAASVSVEKYSPWMINPEQAHPWVASLIGLDAYPLVYRSFGDYTSRSEQIKASVRKR